MATIYYVLAGTTEGPVTPAALDELYNRGVVTDDTQVTMPVEWALARQLPPDSAANCANTEILRQRNLSILTRALGVYG